jgi:hypothetical protein
MWTSRGSRLLFIAPLALVGMVVFVTFGGWLVMSLWNWLLPSLFAWPRVTFWQALALLALCRILFGSLGFRGQSRGHYRGRMAERWMKMTPEERERLRQSWRGRWGFAPPPEGTAAE